MGRVIDYTSAKALLESEYALAEDAFRQGLDIQLPKIYPFSVIDLTTHLEQVFASKTQAYREALLGCAIAKTIDPEIEVHRPYMKQGEKAFNGRSLDEKVVNPFLKEHSIPSSKGPYLSALRRNVSFLSGTLGQKDEKSYTAFTDLVSALEVSGNADDPDTARHIFLRCLLTKFIRLRESANITLAHVQRLSIEQYKTLIDNLLGVPSGGRLPVLLAVGIFRTLRDCFELDWEIHWQGINVADRATGVGGDITVSRNTEILFSVEVTERPIDRARVVSTFTSKIAPGAIDDYIFFFTAREPDETARIAARQYFAQGHEINFVHLADWVMTILGTIGTECRQRFTEEFLNLLADPDVPADLRVAWNAHVRNLLAV